MYYNNSPVDVSSQTFYKFKTPRKILVQFS